MTIISSGGSNSDKWIVDNTGRGKTRSITEGGEIEAANNGDAHIITSGEITLTSANPSAVLWYQNQEGFDLVFDRFIFTSDVSTGGTTNLCKIGLTLEATGLSGGSSSEAIDINTKIGSSTSLNMTQSEIGAEAATVSGGSTGQSFRFKDEDTHVYETRAILPRGVGVAFLVTPPASNTSLIVSLTMNVHRLRDV